VKKAGPKNTRQDVSGRPGKPKPYFPRLGAALPFDVGLLLFPDSGGFGHPLNVLDCGLMGLDLLASTCASIMAPRLRQKSTWVFRPWLSVSNVLPQTGHSWVSGIRCDFGVSCPVFLLEGAASLFLRRLVGVSDLLEEAWALLVECGGRPGLDVGGSSELTP